MEIKFSHLPTRFFVFFMLCLVHQEIRQPKNCECTVDNNDAIPGQLPKTSTCLTSSIVLVLLRADIRAYMDKYVCVILRRMHKNMHECITYLRPTSNERAHMKERTEKWKYHALMTPETRSVFHTIHVSSSRIIVIDHINSRYTIIGVY